MTVSITNTDHYRLTVVIDAVTYVIEKHSVWIFYEEPYLYFYWYQFNNNRTVQNLFTIDFNDVTAPVCISAADLYNQVDAFIHSPVGAGTVTNVTASAPLTSSGGATPNISSSMNTNKLLGRGTAGVGVIEEITLGTGLSMAGTTLNSTGGFTNPMTTFGDIIYENAVPSPERLAGNTAAEKRFLTQTGTGVISAAPAWDTIQAGDIPIDTDGTLAANSDSLVASQKATKTYADTKTTLATVNAQNLSVFAATTSAQLAGVLTDETGTGKAVFGTSPTIETSLLCNYATASTVAIFDGSKNLISAATGTYPNLTELSYLKGVTSAIQTQLGTKNNITYTDISGTSTVVGWSSFGTKMIDLWYDSISKTVWVSWMLDGTSDNATTTFTIPYTAASSETDVLTRSRNSGTFTTGIAYILTATSTVTMKNSTAAGNYTNSGTKTSIGQMIIKVT